MMYSNKFVACIKSKGKILREKEENVYIPFNEEYSIYLKNMESRKASVKISIDGEDVLNGHELLVNPNSFVELEGYLKDITAKNRFKFIPKTQEISEFRGDKPEDSLIRVEFTYEKMKPITQEIKTIHTQDYYPYYSNIWCTTTLENPKYDYMAICSNANINNLQTKCLRSTTEQVYSVQNCSLDSLIDGITVKGSEIEQKFQYGNIGVLEDQPHVIVLKLNGFTEENKEIEKPLTVNTKVQCKTCGKVSKSNAKYCGNCGTYLEFATKSTVESGKEIGEVLKSLENHYEI